MKALGRLWPYVSPFKLQLFTVIVLGLVMSGAQTGLVSLVQFLFDKVFEEKDQAMAILIPCLVPALYLIHAIARYFHLFILKYTADRITVNVQKDLQRKYMALDLSYYGRSDSGSMISRIINDVSVLQWGFTIGADMVREPVTVLLLFGYLLYADWKLTVFILIAGPPILMILNSLSKGVRKYSFRQQEELERFTTTLKETVDGIRIIKSFNLFQLMKERLEKVVTRYLSFRRKVISRQEVAGPVSETLAATIFGAVLIYKGSMIISGEASLGQFMGYFAALAYMQGPIKKVQDGFMKIQPTIASAIRIFEVLDAEETVNETLSPQPFPADWKSIDFKNISFGYGSQPVVNGISFRIARDETLAIVGESGSGKSTLVNLLERFYDPQEGHVFIGSTDIRSFLLRDLRDHISLVTQDVFLFNASLRENIEAGRSSRTNLTVEEAAKLANAHSFIEKMPEKYETRVGDRGGRLSGGEKQRVSIARAMFKNAPIIILDEATSALDSASEVEVQRGLEKLMEGRTTLVIAHRLATITKADRILVLKNGSIVEEGTHSNLISQKGEYSKFFELQTKI